MAKYKWWLHKKEINKIQNDIDRIADRVLQEYPAMVILEVNGLIVMRGYSMHEHENTCLQGCYQLNAGDHIRIIKHNTILNDMVVEHTGVYQIMAQSYGNHAQIGIFNGETYESRVAS